MLGCQWYKSPSCSNLYSTVFLSSREKRQEWISWRWSQQERKISRTSNFHQVQFKSITKILPQFVWITFDLSPITVLLRRGRHSPSTSPPVKRVITGWSTSDFSVQESMEPLKNKEKAAHNCQPLPWGLGNLWNQTSYFQLSGLLMEYAPSQQVLIDNLMWSKHSGELECLIDKHTKLPRVCRCFMLDPHWNDSYIYIYIYGAELLVHGIPPPRRGKGHYVTSIYKTDALPPTPPVVLWYFQSVVASKPTAEYVPNT